VSRPAPAPDVVTQLRALADQLEVGVLEPAQVVGALEALKFVVWTTATAPASAAPTDDSAALDVATAARRSGMSKDWLYREVRAGHLPFARRLGRRVVFDAAGLSRWLDRKSGQRRG
jgi:excisionase family DNA binding protein